MLHRASYKFGDTEKTNYDLQLKVSRICLMIVNIRETLSCKSQFSLTGVQQYKGNYVLNECLQYRVSQKICQNPTHTKPLFWILLLDV